ncbi:MAG: hypothetical protein LBH76_02255, partial [Propionibacteriaceae bacterium]|nr:hypothetical protein [Propionibacteriaceae bacterium]
MIAFDPPTSGVNAPRGRAIYVGAGPGDPELLTLAAVAAFNGCDVVLADTVELLDLLHHSSIHLADDAMVSSVDQLTEAAWATPEERADLVRQAQLGGRTVVRLVPGDPFLDGGVTAEAAALANAGVRFQV